MAGVLSVMAGAGLGACTSQNGGGGIRTLVGGISPETVFETVLVEIDADRT
jgi:hypothetical protein